MGRNKEYHEAKSEWDDYVSDRRCRRYILLFIFIYVIILLLTNRSRLNMENILYEIPTKFEFDYFDFGFQLILLAFLLTVL